MRLVQFQSETGKRHVGVVGEDLDRQLRVLADVERVRDLALEAGRRGLSLEEIIADIHVVGTADYAELIDSKRLLPPLDHPDPARCLITGTGLSHLGSAQTRDSMHSQNQPGEETTLTDSMKLFQWGLKGGKPEKGAISVQPEWFYKGNGYSLVAPEHPLVSPAFALDGGEESELVGLYVIADDGAVLRVGFALGNEFSDHIMERQNYLYLAHSKLRPCSFGPEVRVGEPPADVQGQARIVRDGEVLWSKEFLTGEANMSYGFANLEHHHFKYDFFRQPGDVHCHFFGTATLSFADDVRAKDGDIFEVEAAEFGHSLRNPLRITGQEPRAVQVRTL